MTLSPITGGPRAAADTIGAGWQYRTRLLGWQDGKCRCGGSGIEGKADKAKELQIRSTLILKCGPIYVNRIRRL
jgi:hypothetical protein